MNFEDKVAVIYAGACGIGKSYCEALLQKGCKVYFGDILEKDGQETQQELSTKCKNCKIVFKKCDVFIDEEVKELMKHVYTEEGHVDIVVANAGIMDERNWKKCLHLNMGGVMSVFYAALEYMSIKQGGKGGDFVATSSIAGLQPFFSVPVYSATKHGIVGFIRAWGTAENYALTGIRCNSICPHGIDTKMSRVLTEDQFLLKEQGQQFMEQTKVFWANGFYIKAEATGKALISLLENKSANGQCFEVHDKGTNYASFPKKAI